MNGLKELFSVELTKLAKKRSTKIFLIIYGMLLLGGSVLYLVAESGYGLSMYNGNQYMSASLATMMSFVLPLMAIFLAGSSESLDFSRGTMKNMYLLPISRTKVFTSKLLAVQSLIGLVLLAHFGVSGIIALIVEGLSLAGIGVIVGDYVGAFLVLGLVNLIGNVLSLLFKNNGLAIIVAFIGYMVLSVASMYFGTLDTISITTVINEYGRIFNLSSINLLLSTLAYYIILFIAGMLVFEKKEESLCRFD